jgi:nucleoside-triphosphatase
MSHAGQSHGRIKNILVTGRPGSGKTTLIENVVREFATDAGGFTTGEIRETGVRRGFQITTLDGSTTILAHVGIRSSVRVGKYGVDVSNFERIALPAIRNALERKRIVVIDEIGRMELASDAFCRIVREVLDSSRIVLATIQQHSSPFTDEMKQRKDAILFPVNPESRNTLPAVLKEMIEKILRDEAAIVP